MVVVKVVWMRMPDHDDDVDDEDVETEAAVAAAFYSLLLSHTLESCTQNLYFYCTLLLLEHMKHMRADVEEVSV